jgi:hypothetical protein
MAARLAARRGLFGQNSAVGWPSSEQEAEK